jgi:MMP 1-O-methyltransferase
MEYSEIKSNVESVPGWMDSPDMEWLFNTAKSIKENGLVVELGSWKGRSSCSISLGLNNAKLFCIDTWNGNLNQLAVHYAEKGSGAYNDFITNCQTVAKRVPFILACDSSQAAVLFENESIDWLFIDSDHSPEGIERDLKAWIDKVKPNGIISGHDWYNNDKALSLGLDRVIYKEDVKITSCNIWWNHKDNIRKR